MLPPSDETEIRKYASGNRSRDDHNRGARQLAQRRRRCELAESSALRLSAQHRGNVSERPPAAGQVDATDDRNVATPAIQAGLLAGGSRPDSQP